MWSQRKTLVTGAGGFIGSHLTEQLVKLGADVRAMATYNGRSNAGWLHTSPVKRNIEIVLGDLRDPGFVDHAMQGVDTVFHLGALIAIPYSYVAPQSYVQVNIEGTVNVLQAARRYNVRRVIHTSTSETYGTALRVPIDEGHPLQGQSPYSATKIAADKMAESYFLSFKTPVVTIRPFNTYGPRQSARAIIPTIISQALKNRVVKLGNLNPTRDFNFVLDQVTGFIKAADAENVLGETINLATGKEISICELVRAIAELTNSEIDISIDPHRVRPQGSEVERLCGANDKARRLLGWAPAYTLKQGVNETIEWIKANMNHFDTDSYAI